MLVRIDQCVPLATMLRVIFKTVVVKAKLVLVNLKTVVIKIKSNCRQSWEGVDFRGRG